MHSRIFVLRSREEIRDSNYQSIFDEEEIREAISADYITLQKRDELANDIAWLCGAYTISVKRKDFCFGEGKERVFGIINKLNIKKLITELKSVKQYCIDRIKKELVKTNPSFSTIGYLAYRRYSFWFDLSKWGVLNEIDFLDYLQNENLNEIIITESYDYHA